MSDIIFQKFDRYVLLKNLAEGGMGEVHLAFFGNPGWEKFCALKKILSTNSTPEALLRFKKEVEISVGLNHSNLASVLDVGVVDQDAYMVMDLIEGDNVRGIWNKCAEKQIPFPLPMILYTIKEIAKGLTYAHNYGNLSLVHRDISPPNLMITFSGEIKVLDFGLALNSTSQRFTKPGIIYGKLPYLSPEQAKGDQLTGKSDIYSLGIIFWELVTGRRLFESKGKTNLVKELKNRGKDFEIIPPSKIAMRGDDELDKIILRMLDLNEKTRPSANDVLNMVSKYLATLSPGTNSGDVVRFMSSLYGSEILKERDDEKQKLLKHYRFFEKSEQKKIHVGDVLNDRYTIISILGEGGMGKVFEAVHKNLGKKVAIKILEPKSHMDIGESEIRFKREAKAASKIQHPSVVSVIDYGFTESCQPFLVMELLRGETLCDAINQGIMETYRACRLSSQLAKGIHAAHENGLIHRDIKPENIHIIENHLGMEQIKIIDFGISKSFSSQEEDLTRPGITLGTPEYIAPELLLGEDATPAADIYSFGAVLYEMISGAPPFNAYHTETLIQDKIQGNRKSIFELRPELPVDLKILIESCLSLNPRERPSSLKVISDKLDEIIDGNAQPAFNSITMGYRKPDEDESSGVIPFAMAAIGIIVFILGYFQVGNKEISGLKFSSINLNNKFTPEKVVSVKKVADQNLKTIVAKKTKTISKTIKKKRRVVRRRRKSKRKVVRKRVVKRKRRSLLFKKHKRFLSKAKMAFKNGQYPLAFEFSKKSINAGGGLEAKKVHNKSAQMIGLID
jgi:serine/threonine protein kinase